jgi:hypothetical protein
MRPADLINVAIDELLKQSCELPAYSTLNCLVGHARAQVNQRLYGPWTTVDKKERVG